MPSPVESTSKPLGAALGAVALAAAAATAVLSAEVSQVVEPDPAECACAPRSGGCLWWERDLGGGRTLAPAPVGVTLGVGTWSGACEPKVCSVVAGGRDIWPTSCLRADGGAW